MDILPDDAPAPRLCHLIKWPDFEGYGFNLHAERSNPGQFIGKIDEDSPAEMAGLREGDRIVEVNGVNISNENHRQVVERIKSDANETRLLVLDPAADLWYKEQEIVVKSSQLNIVYCKTPTPRPQSDSPRAKFHSQPSSNLPEENSREKANELSADKHLIEQQVAVPVDNSPTTKDLLPETSSSKSPAPMSPDSGKGDEEACPHLMTVEAEINRQSPVVASTLEACELLSTSPTDNNNSKQHEADSLSAGASSFQSPTPSAEESIEQGEIMLPAAAAAAVPAIKEKVSKLMNLIRRQSELEREMSRIQVTIDWQVKRVNRKCNKLQRSRMVIMMMMISNSIPNSSTCREHLASLCARKLAFLSLSLSFT